MASEYKKMLVPGLIERMLRGDKVTKPVLQITSIRKTEPNEQEKRSNITRYIVMATDGSGSCQIMLASSISYMYDNGVLDDYCIIQIDRFVPSKTSRANKIQPNDILLLFSFTVLAKGSTIGYEFISNQQSSPSIQSPAPLRDMQKILQSDDFKDFTIKVGGTKVKVHKLLLAARSPTFADMMKNNPNADELILEDIEPGVFRVILSYIYNNDIPAVFDETNVKIFVAAGKLKLDELKEKVGDILCNLVTAENSMKLITLASTYGHNKLKKKAFEELKKRLSNIALSDDLMDNLEVLNEIFQAKIDFDAKVTQAMHKIKRN